METAIDGPAAVIRILLADKALAAILPILARFFCDAPNLDRLLNIRRRRMRWPRQQMAGK